MFCSQPTYLMDTITYDTGAHAALDRRGKTKYIYLTFILHPPSSATHVNGGTGGLQLYPHPVSRDHRPEWASRSSVRRSIVPEPLRAAMQTSKELDARNPGPHLWWKAGGLREMTRKDRPCHHTLMSTLMARIGPPPLGSLESRRSSPLVGMFDQLWPVSGIIIQVVTLKGRGWNSRAWETPHRPSFIRYNVPGRSVLWS